MRADRHEVVSIAPQKGNTCAIVVAFGPDPMFASRVARIAPQLHQVLVVDNSGPVSASDDVATVLPKTVALIQNKVNLGIARALNLGVRWALEQGYRWALLLDQDTVVAEDMIDCLVETYHAFPFKNNLAVIGSSYEDPNIQLRGAERKPSNPTGWKEATTVISSGSLLSLAVYEKVGPFRDEFFIDCVDLEYCLRARSRGFTVALVSKPLMRHTVGAITMHRLPWKVAGTSNHAAGRRYYMARNRVVLMREYIFKEPWWVFRTAWSHFKSTLLICLFEQGKWSKLRFTALGVCDGISSNYSRRLD